MEKIRRLEEDRNDVDIEYWPDHSTGFGNRPAKGKRKKKEDFPTYNFGNLRRKKKPVTVTDILYELLNKSICIQVGLWSNYQGFYISQFFLAIARYRSFLCLIVELAINKKCSVPSVLATSK